LYDTLGVFGVCNVKERVGRARVGIDTGAVFERDVGWQGVTTEVFGDRLSPERATPAVLLVGLETHPFVEKEPLALHRTGLHHCPTPLQSQHEGRLFGTQVVALSRGYIRRVYRGLLHFN